MLDIDTLRADTPGCQRVVHLNNAGAGLMPRTVLAAVQDHLRLEAEIGGYEAADAAADRLEGMYASLARLLNAEPDEIAWVENATRAWDMAFYGLRLQPGDRILTHGSEYASNFMAMLQRARQTGLEIDLIPSDGSGQIDVAAIAGLIRPQTRLIAITHVPSQSGLVNPAAEVGRIARAHGLVYLLDACQSAGQVVLDVQEIGCDLLSGTGRKFLRGPRGSGFLYARRSVLDRIEPPFVDLHAGVWTGDRAFDFVPGARRFENWESYVAGRLGLAAAVDYALALGLPAIEARIAALAETLRERLSALPGVAVHDPGMRRCGIVTFTRAGLPAPDLAARLRAQGINIGSSTATWARLDLGARGLDSVARASVHVYNTEAELDRLATAVHGL